MNPDLQMSAIRPSMITLVSRILQGVRWESRPDLERSWTLDESLKSGNNSSFFLLATTAPAYPIVKVMISGA